MCEYTCVYVGIRITLTRNCGEILRVCLRVRVIYMYTYFICIYITYSIRTYVHTHIHTHAHTKYIHAQEDSVCCNQVYACVRVYMHVQKRTRALWCVCVYLSPSFCLSLSLSLSLSTTSSRRMCDMSMCGTSKFKVAAHFPQKSH